MEEGTKASSTQRYSFDLGHLRTSPPIVCGRFRQVQINCWKITLLAVYVSKWLGVKSGFIWAWTHAMLIWWFWVALNFSDPIKALIEGRRRKRGKGQRGMESRMDKGGVSLRSSCTAFSNSLPHSINPQPSLSIWPTINFTSFPFLSLFLKPLFPSHASFLPPFLTDLHSLWCPFPRTNHIQLNSKTTIPLQVTEQSQSGLCWLLKTLFWNKASQFSDCKENPLARLEERKRPGKKDLVSLASAFPQYACYSWIWVSETDSAIHRADEYKCHCPVFGEGGGRSF